MDATEVKSLYLRGGGILALVLLAGVMGFWLGDLSVRDDLPSLPDPRMPTTLVEPGAREVPETYIDPLAPPIYFYAGAPTPEAWNVIQGEISLAAQVGHHQFIVPVAIDWDQPATPSLDEVITMVTDADPMASMILEVDLNPPASWLDRFPMATVPGAAEGQRYVSPLDPDWRENVEEQLATLVERVDAGPGANRVIGYLLRGLQDGRWIRPAAFDKTPGNRAAFQAWLQRIYGSPGALGDAWALPMTGFADVEIPDPPVTNDPKQVFLSFPSQKPIADYYRYTSESTAEVLAALAALVRDMSAERRKVLVPYGFAFELKSNASGHFALDLLLQSDIDGFVSPVSYEDRALGGAGGFMGPVDSAHYHEKLWHIVDDTRTGVSLDPISGEIKSITGINPNDIYDVQRRNFAASVVHRLGHIWADPGGEGWLHNEKHWEVLANLTGVYRGVYPRDNAEGEAEGDGAAQELAMDVPPPGYMPKLVVVVDEHSRYLLQCEDPLNRLLLTNGRDAAIRSGVSTQFCLLSDVLEERAPSAICYLFLNAFELSAQQRDRLHERMEKEKACAIWLYAPGYFANGAPSVENISATVQMQVHQFDKPQLGGSMYTLDGPWMKMGEPIGEPAEWGTLFYIDDPGADPLARYQAVERASAAIRFFEGWASVFVAEPTISAKFLREILAMLEVPSFFRATPRSRTDAAHISDTLIAVHAQQVGELSVDLGQTVNVQDLFDPEIGYPGPTFTHELQTGQSHLFMLSPP